jgi:hypothetical protein
VPPLGHVLIGIACLASPIALVAQDPARGRRPGRLLRFARHVMTPAPLLNGAHAGGVR